MIDLAKISKIKNQKDIKKYDIDKPLFISNYLFHYLIMTNNLTAIKLVKHPIYKENDEGLQGFHLAAKIYSETKNLDMIEYLLKAYPEYSGNRNFFDELFLSYYTVDDSLIKLIKNYKKINWERLLTFQNNVEENVKTYLGSIFLMGSKKLIDFLIANFKFDWKEFKMIPFFNIIFNKNLKTKEIISVLKKLKDYLNLLNSNGKGIIYYAIESDNLDIIKFLVEEDVDIDKYIPIYTYHPFIFAYEFELTNKDNDFTISKYIWDSIKDTHNFKSTNRFGENIAFSILKDKLFTGKHDEKLEHDILKRNDTWDQINVSKETILNQLVLLPFEKYSKYVKGKKVNLKLKNKNDQSIFDIAPTKWKKFLKGLKVSSLIDIKLNNYKFSNTNSFASSLIDAGIFLSYLDGKYKNLYIPKNLDKDNNLTWELGLKLPHQLLEDFNFFSWVIYWEDKNNYLINPHLNDLINSYKNDDKYDAAVVFISLRLPFGGLHAELLFYDFKNNTIERFDPYGNSYDLDPYIDTILEEELTWNTGFNYLNVKNYMPVSGFQTLSDENNEMSEKPGDFGGYCLAWCFWYLEHRMINLKYNVKELFPKLFNKLLKNENSLLEYIRNYANSINKERLKILKKIGIKDNKLTNLNFTVNEERKILEYIIKKTTI